LPAPVFRDEAKVFSTVAWIAFNPRSISQPLGRV
jgi:hypothetical protein